MFLCGLKISNFRTFGEGDKSFELKLNSGLTAIVGENDSGKSAVIDALRFALGTTDQEWYKLDDDDFHREAGLAAATEITIQCEFCLAEEEAGAFVEYLTYSKDGAAPPVLYVNWTARETKERRRGRPYRKIEICSGLKGDGPSFAPEVRELLCATYLKPLRDADQALSSGRGSRLSQVLSSTRQVSNSGIEHMKGTSPDPTQLSVRGIGDYANDLLEVQDGIKVARGEVDKHLGRFALRGDEAKSRMRVGMNSNPDARLRQLLEKLDLSLHVEGSSGLGTNNTLFMACELILLAQESEVNKLLLIEEPEAHLHPQKQLRVMQALQELAKEKGIQIVVTTHSPNLASVIQLDNLVLLWKSRPFSLSREFTMLGDTDYSFLQRFLDTTKANLFFARGVMIVEGDAENILMPVFATILNKDFMEYGISMVNVGGVGLGRYARIFQRKLHADVPIRNLDIPVACLTDMDVMPDCAPAIIGKIKSGEPYPTTSGRRWRAKRDYASLEALSDERKVKETRASGQSVKSFVADEWTLEYDLALGRKDPEAGFIHGLGEDVFVAACLAGQEDDIFSGKKSRAEIVSSSSDAFKSLRQMSAASEGSSVQEVVASHIYAKFVKKKVSKAIAAQYLAQILMDRFESGTLTADSLRASLPTYITGAIDHVTQSAASNTSSDTRSDA